MVSVIVLIDGLGGSIFLFQHVNITDDNVTCELGEEGRAGRRHRFLGGERQGLMETTTKITNGSQLC